jgi:hypothetical protein
MTFRKVGSVFKANGAPRRSPLPDVLTFKKRATRILPDGKEIASYYSSQTGTTIIYPSTFKEKETR